VTPDSPKQALLTVNPWIAYVVACWRVAVDEVPYEGDDDAHLRAVTKRARELFGG
jgi:hypothetical protein